MMGDILEIYEARVRTGQLAPDLAQADVAARLDELAGKLGRTKSGFLIRPKPPRGLYIWGGVGRGKSMLMDLFFDHVPVKRKLRTHFHDFMLETHAFIAKWRKMDDAARRSHEAYVRSAGDDPIAPAAKRIADQARLLCFDEFFVTDITDAMILGRLFEQLWDRDVTVVATSNRHPDDLYKNGVNRQLFKPFIEMIKTKSHVVELVAERDYRLERLQAAPVYYHPIDADADKAMDAAWARMTGGATEIAETLTIQGRSVLVPRTAAGCARINFADFCERPLGAADYLALARRFHTVFIDRTPKLSPANRNAAKRFVTLVDALYEARAKLVISADAEPDELYTEGDGAFEFERTASRLFEMQSVDYLAAKSAHDKDADED